MHDRFFSLYSKDEVVLIDGKLSVREDEDIKIIVESISPLNGNTYEESTAQDEISMAKNSDTKLYIKTNREEMPEIKNILSSSGGDVPVYINLPDEGITLLAPRDWWCSEDSLDNIADNSDNIKVVRKI